MSPFIPPALGETPPPVPVLGAPLRAAESLVRRSDRSSKSPLWLLQQDSGAHEPSATCYSPFFTGSFCQRSRRSRNHPRDGRSDLLSNPNIRQEPRPRNGTFHDPQDECDWIKMPLCGGCRPYMTETGFPVNSYAGYVTLDPNCAGNTILHFWSVFA